MKKKLKILILTFVLFILNQEPALSYIDPASGSMLFSAVLGAVSGLFFILNTRIIKFKIFSFFKKDLMKNNIPFVIYSEGNQYFKVFKPILDEFEKRQISLVFYTSSEDDPIFECNYKHIKSEYIGKNFKAYAKLAFLKADICLMTTPNLEVFHLKRSKYVKWYCHIFHGIAGGVYYLKLFSLDYYNAVLCNSDFEHSHIRELELKRNLPEKELITTGSTYLDYLKSYFLDNIPVKNEKLTLLYMPAWGEKGSLKTCCTKLIDELLKNDWNIIIRPHPQAQISEKDLILKLQKKYENNKNLYWDLGTFMDILLKADVLISDTSCSMIDWAFLFNKPFLYIQTEINLNLYEASDLETPPMLSEIIENIGIKITEDNICNIKEIINNLKNNDYQNLINKYKDLAWQKQGEAAKNAVDYLTAKQKELAK